MKNIYLSQVNNTYGKNAFLPYSVGIIQAYAQQNPTINENYNFAGFLYLRENIEAVVDRLVEPSILGVSCYIWNWEYSLAVVRAVKAKYPDCLVVLGGPHVPVLSDGFFHLHPYADLLVHYEGELAFADILLEALKSSPDYTSIAGLSVRLENNDTFKTAMRERVSDLSIIPSPYLTGVFDNLIKEPYDFHASQETNRGCPYSCTFCDWGSNVMAKLKHFDIDRLLQEIEWFADHKIDLLYNCLAEGTLVSTANGLVPIEKIKPDDVVIGFDEDNNNIISSVVEKTVYSGIKDVYRLEFMNGYIDATSKHKIYTNRGWKTVSELQSGDQILSCVRQGHDKKAAETKSLLSSMLGSFRRTNWKSKNSSPKRKLCPSTPSSFRTYKKQEFKGESRNCRKECNYKSKTWLCMDVWQKQSYAQIRATNRTTKKNSFLQIDAKILERSNMGETTSGKSWQIAKCIRANGEKIHRRQRSSIQICRRFQFLAGTMSVRQVQKSRFYSLPKRNQKNYSGTRALLASKSSISSRRDRGLCPKILAMYDYLGQRKIRRVTCNQNTDVYWTKLDSIKFIGKRKTYDVINAIPSHNFFANGILVSNCDANYGILPRDLELTERMAEIKRATGFPKKFRAAYAKNSNDAVFNIAKVLHAAEMNKGITLSFQSMNDKTLTLIKRKNIKIENFTDIVRRYRSEGIATYSEIIIGLPGETYDTFADGLNLLVQSGQHDSIQVYTCEVLPNSEMNHPAYRELHEIKTIHTPVLFFHGTPSEDPHHEFYDMVISTATLPYSDWLKCQKISWMFQAYHCLGLTQSIALYLNSRHKVSFRLFYEQLLEFADTHPETVIGKAAARATECFTNLGIGKPWGFVDQRFGNIIWPPEEAGFLMSVIEKKQFYIELLELVLSWHDDEILRDVVAYQEAVVWAPFEGLDIEVLLSHNVHEYLEGAYYDKESELACAPVRYLIKSKKAYDDLETYAKEVVWYGRKGGRFRHIDITTVDE